MPEVNTEHLLLLVVGAHLNAEAADRPLGYRLQESVQNWLSRHCEDTNWPLTPMVCSDVLYLNSDELHGRPLISIGGPGVNALSAYLYQKIPTALAIEDKLVIQMDVDMTDLRVGVWGIDSSHTTAAVELFEKKYLDDFMKAAVTQVEPDVEI